MAQQIYLEPFNTWVICLAYSDKKPRHWYSIDRHGEKSVTYLGFQKIMMGKYYAYRIIFGPFCITYGRPTWRNQEDAPASNTGDPKDHVGSTPTVGTKDGNLD